MLPKSSKRWPLLAKLVTGFCLCLSATDGPGQEARKPSRPVSAVTAGHTPSGESHKSAAGTPRAVLDEDLTNEEETDDEDDDPERPTSAIISPSRNVIRVVRRPFV